MIIAYNNLIETGTLTASSTYPKFPLSNLLNDRLCEYTRLSSGQQYIQLAFNELKPVNTAIVSNVNFTSAVIQLSDDNFNTIKAQYTLTADGTNQLIARFDSISAKAFRLVIDSGNVKRIGKLYIGEFVQLPVMEISQKLSFETTKKPVRSLSGQVYVAATGYSVVGFECNFPLLTDANVSVFKQFWGGCENQKGFYTYLWSKRSDKLPLMFAILDQDTLIIERNDNSRFPHKTKLSVKELK